MLKTRSWPVPSTSLAISILTNILLTMFLVSKPSTEPQKASLFADLTRDIPKQWSGNQAGSPEDWARVWYNESSIDAGIVALNDGYAHEMGLPRAQRWPWDGAKGIYVLNGYHNLHCVQTVHLALEEFRDDRQQTIPWAHVQHCLLTLRDEVLCSADDTPRYTGFQPEPLSGYGQVRMCRDWGKLEAWASHHSRAGCWRDIPGRVGVNGFRILDQYRFCAEGNEHKVDAETKWKDQ